MENQDADRIYGNADDAPYINGTLLPRYAHATAFADALPDAAQRAALRLDGGGHERLFRSHLHHGRSAVEPTTARPAAITWSRRSRRRAAGSTGCRTRKGSSGDGRAARSRARASTGRGTTRSSSSRTWPATRRPRTTRTAPRTIAISPRSRRISRAATSPATASSRRTCATTCTARPAARIRTGRRAGDDWLAANLPPLIDFVNANGGVIFIIWEEGDAHRHDAVLRGRTGRQAGLRGRASLTRTARC